MPNPSLAEMFARLLRPPGQTRAAKTVEAFGWLILAEGIVLMFAPHFVTALLHLPALEPQGANYLRLAALLVCGVGMLHTLLAAGSMRKALCSARCLIVRWCRR